MQDLIRPGERVRATTVHSKHGGDAIFPVVSAASIVAKVTRDGEMERIRDELGRSVEEIGSGYPSDRRTARFLETWIRENGVAPPHARRSWKTVRRLEQRYADSQRRLTDFG